MIPTENTLGDRRQTLARTVVLLAMLIAFFGAMLGVVFGIIFGTVTGPEAKIIEFCTALTGAMLVLFYFKPATATSVIAGVLTVYFIFHLNAGSILAYRASGDFLRIIPYTIWFFPLVVFHELANFSRYKRPLSVLVALSPIPISAYVISHPTTPVAIGVLDASVTFLTSFYASILFINVFSRNRDEEILRAARTEEADRAAAVLRASDERFRIIADTVSDALWDYDLETKKWWLAPGWSQRLGMEFDEEGVSLSDWPQSVDKEDRERVVSSFMSALGSGTDTWSVEFQLKDHNANSAAILANASLIRNPAGRVTRMLGNARNITAEKRQQEGYSRSLALEAVGKLTGGIAHDFNNLIMIIQGNAELLSMANLAEDDAESVSLINEASESAAKLTHKLLSFSGQSMLHSERVLLNDLIAKTVRLLEAGVTESVQIQTSTPDDLWDVRVDANGLEQVLVNLVINARDAMPKGGTVTISCENCPAGSELAAIQGDIIPSDYVLLSVTDTGEGIAPEHQSKVFEPFFTTKDVGKGTGLGLSTVYGFAKQSGGHLVINSEMGQGTSVSLYLPKFGPELASSEEAEVPGSQPLSPTGQRILIVEDQPQIMRQVEKYLSSLGYQTISASDGQKALALVANGERFDLLFSDVIMPNQMNGAELARAIRDKAPRTRVLFTSGYPAAAFDDIGLSELIDRPLLRKPYKLEDLRAAVEKALR